MSSFQKDPRIYQGQTWRSENPVLAYSEDTGCDTKGVAVREEEAEGKPVSTGRRAKLCVCVLSLCLCQHSRSEMGEHEARMMKTYRYRGFMPHIPGNQRHHSECHIQYGAGARWRQTPLD